MAQTRSSLTRSNAPSYTALPSENCQPSGYYSMPNGEITHIHAQQYQRVQPNTHPTLAKGETAMPYAPNVTLPNGNTAVPQHYLHYQHTLESIQAIINDIGSLPLTPIFADKDERGCYLQVGIIGEENYDRSTKVLPKKIVYGRKWRIEPSTPTSEIIQTAFLAVKKVWEHETREFLTVKDAASGKTSALFSSHHDLPLMASNADLIHSDTHSQYSPEDIRQFLPHVLFKGCGFTIDGIIARDRNSIIDLHLHEPTTPWEASDGASRFCGFEATLVLDRLSPNALLHALIDALIAHSDHYIEELFTYRGFSRFSRQHNALDIAALSIASRPYADHMQDDTFASTFQQINYETDACRVPCIGTGKLADKNRQLIEQVDGLTGHLPREPATSP